MDDPANTIYFSSGPSRNPHSRQPSTSGEQNIFPHFLASLPCEVNYQPYLSADGDAQNISVQFTGQDTTQLDSDILPRHVSFDHENTMTVLPIAYPESSQRTTSHALPPYSVEASRFNDLSSCNFATLHIEDAPAHGIHAPRRGSWPSQMGYSTWTRSPLRTARSSASEPPENTSDESYQDSDVDEATQMSPMLNQFQVHASRNVDLPAHHMYHAQALQPSVMTFQLSETMLRPVDDPENRQTFRRLAQVSVAVNEGSEVTHTPPSSSTFPSSPPSTSFGDAMLQGPGMRFQHDSERQIRIDEYRVPVVPNSVPFPSHSPTNLGVGDQRVSGSKQPKKSKMHQCEHCKKVFPRPSGLATHMNSHSGAKPYKCIVPDCDKSFAVRSNAKRHLRTHGINPAATDALVPRFTVGFEEPMVTQVHDAGRQPSRYRWITHDPSPHEREWDRQRSPSSAVSGGSRTDLTFQTSMSSATSSTVSNVSDEDYEQAASSSVADVQQYQSDYGGADEFSGTYPGYGQHLGRG